MFSLKCSSAVATLLEMGYIVKKIDKSECTYFFVDLTFWTTSKWPSSICLYSYLYWVYYWHKIHWFLMLCVIFIHFSVVKHLIQLSIMTFYVNSWNNHNDWSLFKCQKYVERERKKKQWTPIEYLVCKFWLTFWKLKIQQCINLICIQQHEKWCVDSKYKSKPLKFLNQIKKNRNNDDAGYWKDQ